MRIGNRCPALLVWLLSIPLLPCPAHAEAFQVDTVDALGRALDAADGNGEDDTIELGAGNYLLPETLTYDSEEDRALTLQGESAAEVVVDGGGYVRLLYLWTHGENAHLTLQGITFCDGIVSDDTAALVFVRTQGADITIEDCAFRDGWAGSLFGNADAAGLFARSESGGTLRLERNRFVDNRAKGIGGGAMLMGGLDSTLVLVNNLFGNNRASTQGGGADIRVMGGQLYMVHNTFTGNENYGGTGYGGGGLYVRTWNDETSAVLANNIIWGNLAATGVGDDVFLEDDGDDNGTGSGIEVFNNVFGDLEYQDGSALSQKQNSDTDPLLTADFHLRAGSPCIDRAEPLEGQSPAVDFEGDPRATGSAPDIGADEYVGGYHQDAPADSGSGSEPEAGARSADASAGNGDASRAPLSYRYDAAGSGCGCRVARPSAHSEATGVWSLYMFIGVIFFRRAHRETGGAYGAAGQRLPSMTRRTTRR